MHAQSHINLALALALARRREREGCERDRERPRISENQARLWQAAVSTQGRPY